MIDRRGPDGSSDLAAPTGRQPVEKAVLKAFAAARDAGRSSVECYRAGVAAWCSAYPDQAPEYAAKRAVAVILAACARRRAKAAGA